MIEEILKDGEFDIWAAWGTLIETEQYLKDCLEGIVKIAEKYGCHWYTIGERTKAGHPHHPLYLRRDAEMEGISGWPVNLHINFTVMVSSHTGYSFN